MMTSNKDVLSWHRSATSKECLNVFEIILNCFLMMLGTLFGVLLAHITKKVVSYIKWVLKQEFYSPTDKDFQTKQKRNAAVRELSEEK